MEIKPVAIFRSPLSEKFGIPRQSGLVPALKGTVEFLDGYGGGESMRGLEGFGYLWLIWGFNTDTWHDTVRPPRLGGNGRVGVFASRSPFRPNPLGLSSVKILKVDRAAGRIEVSGADLMDGTPVFDVKPYIPYTDSHPDAAGGFVDTDSWTVLEPRVPAPFSSMFSKDELEALEGVLAQDPRPRYQDDGERVYGMSFAGRNVQFRVEDGKIIVTNVE